jgi:hypothetical protein
MPLSGTNPQAEAPPLTLPLFRPEALAAQETMHGDVLRIRPLSLVFFLSLAAALGAALLIYLITGRYHKTAVVADSLSQTNSAQSMALLPASITLACKPFIHWPSDRSTP